MDKGTVDDGTSKEEIKRLLAENQYMRSTLDILYKYIIIRDGTPQMEIKPPDVLKNDQELIDLTTNVLKVFHKFYSLEMELDDTYGRIFQFFTMIDAGMETQSLNQSKFMATGRRARGIPPKASERSQNSMELEKELERIASTWLDMKENKRRYEEELSVKEVKILELMNTNSRVNQHMEMNVNAPKQVGKAMKASEQKTKEQLRDHQQTLEQMIKVNEKQLERVSMLQEVNASMTEKARKAAEEAHQKKEEYAELESDKEKLMLCHEDLKQKYEETLKKTLTLEGEIKQLESYVLAQKRAVYSLQQNEKSIRETFFRELKEYKVTIKQLNGTIKQLNEDNEHLLTRLSNIASDCLTHENTNITDLSDPDRPARLSEIYSELYDNEWTDAFEELTGNTDKDNPSPESAIQFLLKILLKAFQKCREMTWDIYEAMKSVTVTLDTTNRQMSMSKRHIEGTGFPKSADSKSDHCGNVSENIPPAPSSPCEEKHQDQSSEPSEVNGYEIISKSEIEECVSDRAPSAVTNFQPQENKQLESNSTAEKKKDLGDKPSVRLPFSVDETKKIKRVWRKTSNAIKPQALELLRSVLITCFEINDKDMPKLTKYLNSCLELCWKMGMQEKPLHIYTGEKKDFCSVRLFDHERFRAYTKTGTHVHYIVWPALLLYEGGEILCRGVAQGC